MFDSLGEKFDSLWRKLRGQGKLTESNIEDALREVRLALLEADVNRAVVGAFVDAVRADALGQEVLRSLTPEQQFIKIVHRELVRALGGNPTPLDLDGPSPLVVMLVGLDGAGKPTTVAKLARLLRDERGRTPLLVAAAVSAGSPRCPWRPTLTVPRPLPSSRRSAGRSTCPSTPRRTPIPPPSPGRASTPVAPREPTRSSSTRRAARP